MTSEAAHCSDFSNIATSANVSLTSGKYLTVSVSGDTAVTVEMPASISARVIYLGSKSASISSKASSSAVFDYNGVCWSD